MVAALGPLTELSQGVLNALAPGARCLELLLDLSEAHAPLGDQGRLRGDSLAPRGPDGHPEPRMTLSMRMKTTSTKMTRTIMNSMRMTKANSNPMMTNSMKMMTT